MHTSTELRSDHFQVTIAGEPATIENLFPGFGEHDRLGIVVARDWGGTGASTIVLAAVTAFYDRLRAIGDQFVAYPDFFAFNVERPRGSLSMLDVYPEHKEPIVAADPEQILRAINDRAVTRLLVEEGPLSSEPAFEVFTRASAERRIRTALRYSSTGRVADPDVVIAGSAQTESYVEAVLATAADPAQHSAAKQIRSSRTALLEGERPVESFARITLERALRSLAGAVRPA